MDSAVDTDKGKKFDPSHASNPGGMIVMADPSLHSGVNMPKRSLSPKAHSGATYGLKGDGQPTFKSPLNNKGDNGHVTKSQ